MLILLGENDKQMINFSVLQFNLSKIKKIIENVDFLQRPKIKTEYEKELNDIVNLLARNAEENCFKELSFEEIFVGYRILVDIESIIDENDEILTTVEHLKGIYAEILLGKAKTSDFALKEHNIIKDGYRSSEFRDYYINLFNDGFSIKYFQDVNAFLAYTIDKRIFPEVLDSRYLFRGSFMALLNQGLFEELNEDILIKAFEQIFSYDNPLWINKTEALICLYDQIGRKNAKVCDCLFEKVLICFEKEKLFNSDSDWVKMTGVLINQVDENADQRFYRWCEILLKQKRETSYYKSLKDFSETLPEKFIKEKKLLKMFSYYKCNVGSEINFWKKFAEEKMFCETGYKYTNPHHAKRGWFKKDKSGPLQPVLGTKELTEVKKLRQYYNEKYALPAINLQKKMKDLFDYIQKDYQKNFTLEAENLFLAILKQYKVEREALLNELNAEDKKVFNRIKIVENKGENQCVEM